MQTQQQKTLSILMVCPDFKPNLGGEAQLALNLALEFQKQGSDVTVLARPYPGRDYDDSKLPVNVVRELGLDDFPPLGSLSGWTSWLAAMSSLKKVIRSQLQQCQADLIFVTSFHTWGTLAVRKMDVPYALFLHGEDVKLTAARGRVARWFFTRACMQASKIVFNSEYSRMQISDISEALLERSESVGCGVQVADKDLAISRNEARQALGWNEAPVLLTVARLIPRKGVGTVIRALPAIIEKFPDCRYVVVGDGPDVDRLKSLVTDLQLGDSVQFTGPVDDAMKNNVFAASDIYVMVSYAGKLGEAEGFGISFLEANLFGLPVIGSYCGGIPECVENKVNGLLVEPRQPDQVAAAVITLLEQPSLRAEMAEHGRQRIHETFNWKTIAAKIMGEFRKITGVA